MLLSSTEPCAHWAQRLAAVPIPVLRATRDLIERARAEEDRVDANSLADLVLRDPLMTLRVLIHVAQAVGERLATPVETVTAGLVLTGIGPFFRAFDDLPVLEDVLAHEPQALAGALHAIERSHAAARLAAAIAIERLDEDAEVLHQAALLDNFAGLLLWCAAPALALEMARLQRADTTLRSADAQRRVLGVELVAIEHALMAAWRLPDFLRNMTNPGHMLEAGPHSVMLAVRIARHAQHGWDNAALPADYAELGHLLNLPPGVAARWVQRLDG